MPGIATRGGSESHLERSVPQGRGNGAGNLEGMSDPRYALDAPHSRLCSPQVTLQWFISPSILRHGPLLLPRRMGSGPRLLLPKLLRLSRLHSGHNIQLRRYRSQCLHGILNLARRCQPSDITMVLLYTPLQLVALHQRRSIPLSFRRRARSLYPYYRHMVSRGRRSWMRSILLSMIRYKVSNTSK